MARKSIYQTFLTLAALKANIGIAGNPPMKDELYYVAETDKQGLWYYDPADTTTAENIGLVVVTTTGSHRFKRRLLEVAYIYKNWFTGSDPWYTSVSDANSTVAASYRKRTMRVIILESGALNEYWWRDGTADGDLIPIAGEIGVDNGATTGGALELLTAPDPSTIHCQSLLVTGVNGISVNASNVGDQAVIEIDGGGAVAFLSGDYEDMPSPTTPGITYYSNNQLFGRYLSTGSIWEYVPGTNTFVYEQWLGNIPAFYAQSISGAGAGSFIDSSTIGRWRNDTGTDTTGTSSVRLSQSMASSFSGINRICMYAERVQVSALSDGTNRYVARIGRDVGSDVNGVWFEYSDNVNSGKWLCVSYNGSRQTTDSGVTVSASATDTLCWVLDFSGTDTVYFYINGVLVATHTTQIPANFTSAYPFAISIQKTAGASSRGLMFGRTLINVELTTGI